jgi:hypothetical protein
LQSPRRGDLFFEAVEGHAAFGEDLVLKVVLLGKGVESPSEEQGPDAEWRENCTSHQHQHENGTGR